MTHPEHRRGEFLVTTDPARLNIEFVHAYLTRSYWSEGISREIVERGIANSLCFGAYDGHQQVGFARVITDYATFAYLADVFIIESHRGKGLSKFLMECIVNDPRLQRLRRWVLGTRDAHGLYAQYGFKPLATPERFMEIHNPGVYEKTSSARLKDEKTSSDPSSSSVTATKRRKNAAPAVSPGRSRH